jgi:hypothetical protein
MFMEDYQNGIKSFKKNGGLHDLSAIPQSRSFLSCPEIG